MSRLYPALDVAWPDRPADEHLDLLMAEVDDDGPLAVEDIESGLRIFFPTTASRDRAALTLLAREPGIVCTPLEIDDEDWAARSQASIGPITVGRLIVVPPWLAGTRDAQAAAAGAITLIIQPSMGFGTGHHASTRLCLRLLQEISLTGKSVLDVGTGSGVLAIAAAALGAAQVLAVDNDEDAVTSARENIELNQAAVTLELSGLENLRETHAFDVVLANLTGALLVRQAAAIGSLLHHRGILIVSGVTAAEGPGVKAAFEHIGLTPVREFSEDGWVGLSLTIPTSPTGT